MAKTVTPGAISILLAKPSPDSPAEIPEIIVQVVDLKPVGTSSTRFTFTANDGSRKLKAMLPTHFASEIHSGNLQNLGLIHILDYTLNSIPNQPEKALIVVKCAVVSPSLDKEIKIEAKKEEIGILLKPKHDIFPKSAAQIVREHHGNAAPAARMSMTRRVFPLVSLNPYQGNWTIKVRVTSKGNLRTYRNAKGEGCVFNVELTDEDGTQIQATMFNEAAKKFFPVFELGKVYYVSKGSLKVANRQFKTVSNDYEMTLNDNAIVEEAVGEVFVPETKYNFVKIDQLGSYVNRRELVDIVGIVQNVSSTLSVRRKIDNETIPKRDITIADDTNKTVTISLWNDLAINVGQELLDMAETSPVVALKGLKVGDFQGVSLSTISKSTVLINPDLPESKKLKSWYESEGKGASMSMVGASLVSAKTGSRSVYTERVTLSHIVNDPTLGQDKPAFFSISVHVSLIKSDQSLWYPACNTCNKKVTQAVESGYWCESCLKNVDCSLRYALSFKVSDHTGEAWLTAFSEDAEQIIGCSAEELDRIKKEEGDDRYQLKLKDATWVPHLFRVTVLQREYNGEKKQRITVKAHVALDCAVESRYLLEEISKMTVA